MKKLFLLLLASVLTLTCATTFTSCDKDEDPIEEPDPTPEEQPENKPANTNIQAGKYGPLHIDGRYLCDSNNVHVNLHGFWQTYSPWFNGGAWGEDNWGNYDVDACLEYNQKEIDKILKCGWKVDFMRVHMDSYWSLSRSRQYGTDRAEWQDFKEVLFQQYLDEVFVPMIEHCIDRGLYVVLMPGYSSPEYLEYGDGFFKVLEKLWKNISTHKDLCNNPNVMFEIVNEPRSMKKDGKALAGTSDASNKALTEYMQHFVDLIRENANNIIWVPGTGYQSQYAGYAKYRLSGDNLGFAVHCYPGWYGSDAEQESAELGGGMGGGYTAFRAGWDAQITPAANIAPIMVTEMDWAPAKYNKSWGKSFTGEAGGSGFGANFKYLADMTGNVSYILFTAPNDLADYSAMSVKPTTNYWNDPKGCPWQIYHWYQEYAEGRVQPLTASQLKIGGSQNGKLTLSVGTTTDLIVNAIQSGDVVYPLQSGVEIQSSNSSVVKVKGTQVEAVNEGEATLTVSALGMTSTCNVTVGSLFPLTNESFNPSIWETGSFDESTHTFISGTYGFGGWQFGGIDITGHQYIVAKLGAGSDMSCSPSFRLFDDKGYWGGAVECSFKNREARIEIASMKRTKDNSLVDDFDATNVTIVGFWTTGGKPIVIESVGFED